MSTEIVCALSEKVYIDVDGSIITLENGKCLLVIPGASVSVLEKGKVDYLCCEPDESHDGVFRVYLDSRNAAIIDNEKISSTVSSLCKELEYCETVFSTELLSLMFKQLLLYLSRHFSEIGQDDKAADRDNLRICNLIMKYINENLYSIRNLSDVAASLGYNYSYISTLFHRSMGITLNGYFKSKRMNEAKSMLLDSKKSISEIARIMNYSSVYAFSKAFKEYFGESPGYYSGRFAPKK